MAQQPQLCSLQRILGTGACSASACCGGSTCRLMQSHPPQRRRSKDTVICKFASPFVSKSCWKAFELSTHWAPALALLSSLARDGCRPCALENSARASAPQSHRMSLPLPGGAAAGLAACGACGQASRLQAKSEVEFMMWLDMSTLPCSAHSRLRVRAVEDCPAAEVSSWERSLHISLSGAPARVASCARGRVLRLPSVPEFWRGCWLDLGIWPTSD